VQLKKLALNNECRRHLTRVYWDALQQLAPQVSVPFRHHIGVSAAHLLPVLLPMGLDKSGFIEGMKVQGIQTSFHYPPIHTFTAFNTCRDQALLPITEAVAEREVTLPLYPALSNDDVLCIVRAVTEALGQL
jgi:dTDP-4-amino-4,6-dideoxygalactose transaminase